MRVIYNKLILLLLFFPNVFWLLLQYVILSSVAG